MRLSELEVLVKNMRIKAKADDPHVLFYNDDERRPATLTMEPVKDIGQNVVNNPDYDKVAPLALGDYSFALTAFKYR